MEKLYERVCAEHAAYLGKVRKFLSSPELGERRDLADFLINYIVQEAICKAKEEKKLRVSHEIIAKVTENVIPGINAELQGGAYPNGLFCYS